MTGLPTRVGEDPFQHQRDHDHNAQLGDGIRCEVPEDFPANMNLDFASAG